MMTSMLGALNGRLLLCGLCAMAAVAAALGVLSLLA